VILLDAGAGLSHDTVLPLGLADEVVLVSTPDEVSVVDTDKTRALAKRVGGTLRGVVLTKTVEADLADLSTGIDVPLLGVVPQDEAVGEAAAERRAVPAFAPQSPAGTAYMDIAADLFGVAVTAMDFAEGDGTAGASIEEAAVDPFPGEEAAVEESEPEDEAKDDATDRATDGSKTDATADAERDTDEESRGFFSRLFGR
jgi:septum site-determining protein MinD